MTQQFVASPYGISDWNIMVELMAQQSFLLGERQFSKYINKKRGRVIYGVNQKNPKYLMHILY